MNDSFNIDDLLNSNPEDSAESEVELDALLEELNTYGISSEATAESNDSEDEFLFKRNIPAQSPPAGRNQPVRTSADSFPPQRYSYTAEENPEPAGFSGVIFRHRIAINLILLFIAVLLSFGIYYLIHAQSNVDPYNNRILNNVYIGSVNVGGMTKSEALKAVESGIGEAFGKPMAIVMGNSTTELTQAVSGAKPDLSAAVDAAYAIGRDGSAAERKKAYLQCQDGFCEVALSEYLNLNVDAIRTALAAGIPRIDSNFTQSSYSLDGELPDLSADSFDETAPCQTLKLYLGTPGSEANMDAILSEVLEAYNSCIFTVEIDQRLLVNAPDEINLDAIYNDIYIAPEEAYTDPANNQTYDGSCGYTFDRDEARRLIDAASYGDTVEVTLSYIVPQRLSSKDYYSFTLSTFSTEIQGEDAGYITNMRLAARTLDGMVLQPGESFSFDMAVPNRTAANGYANAPMHLGTCADKSSDGGCDQVATTLFGAALCADLNIIEFHTVTHACAFTSVRGTEVFCSDLKFSNCHSFAIQIQAKVSGNKVIIRFLSEEETGWYIELESREVATSAPGTAYVYNTGRPANEEFFVGLAGGSFNLIPNKYDRSSKQLIEAGIAKARYIQLNAASRLVTAG